MNMLIYKLNIKKETICAKVPFLTFYDFLYDVSEDLLVHRVSTTVM